MFNYITEFITAIATASATVLSAISVRQLIREKNLREKLEETNLSITPKAKFSNCVDEVFFLYLAFSNESSLPISILDIKLSLPTEGNITNARNGEGGTTLINSVRVSESKTRYEDSDIIIHNFTTFSLPLTIAPFSSFGGYLAFHAGMQDSAILCNKEVLMKVRTSRKTFEVRMILYSDNFYDFSYRDDGTVFGDACSD